MGNTRHPMLQINDSFKKIIITNNKDYPWFDRNGVYFINIQEFPCFLKT